MIQERDLIDWGLTAEFITPEFLASQGFSSTLPRRFIAKVQKSEGCWLWTAAITHRGYGTIKRDSSDNRAAHIVSWILHNGPILDGLWVLHSCDNRPCVRPDHLYLGTATENTSDMMAKRRDRHVCKLDWDAVCQIRTDYETGRFLQRELGAIYGISQQEVSRIVHGRRWASQPIEYQVILKAA